VLLHQILDRGKILSNLICGQNALNLTEPEIKSSFKELGRPDKYLSMSVDARQELDRNGLVQERKRSTGSGNGKQKRRH